MFSHMTVGTNDLDRARRFYDAVFATMGVGPGQPDAKGRLVYVKEGALFIVGAPIDGRAASPANGGTIGFGLADPAAIDAWHRAGTENGGTSCEDPPGIRHAAIGPLYLAYMRDPDGNKLCAAHRL